MFILDKSQTILQITNPAYQNLYRDMFEVVWKDKFSQYSEQDKQNCLKKWTIASIEHEYSLYMTEHLKKQTATKKQYKVINVPRNDNSQTIFRTQ